MKPLLDFDILKYEVGFSGQQKEGDEIIILPFDHVAELLDNKIKFICREVEATEPPLGFLSADTFTIKQVNKKNKDKPLILLPNFREEISITKTYKGTRKADKPFHYNNLIAYMLANYDCNVANGIEADDAMCIEQYGRDKDDTIICTRDKDLRQCPGWHYSWECGKQSSIGPTYTDDLGWLEKRKDGKVLGYGKAFFFYQMLTGDQVDNIQGVPGYGPVKAYKKLTGEEKLSEQGMYQEVVSAYQEAFKEEWKVHIREMANLLWMVRELDEEDKPVLYKPYSKDGEDT